MSQEKKFLVNSMLGNLVTWLRILGYDTEYWKGDDKEMLEIAKKEGRIILTKDRGVARFAEKNGIPVLELMSSDVPEALATTAEAFGISLEFDRKRTRCPVCNTPLKSYGSRWLCDKCGKEYWIGSHWVDISKRLSEARRIFLERKSLGSNVLK
ncbi:MAG: Mut7-C RNAse domain-containing protein [Thaumarchaeota archaeon]|nr:Mut7-C RNAse domain-containing protein [Candidatus Terraquivivens yellowstonensis]